jgi:hypothetical protein
MRKGTRVLAGYIVTFSISIVIVSSGFAQYTGVAKHRSHEKDLPSNLLRFDASDFDVLRDDKWERLTRSHSETVTVHWPDGRQTKGLENHVHSLKAMFSYAPDARVRAHSVKFGSEDWTCVISDIEGTFTRPWRSSDGKEFRPNGRRFHIPICTVRHWNNKGLVEEEYLFWNNQLLMRQLGLTTAR